MTLEVRGRGALSPASLPQQVADLHDGTALLHLLDPTPGVRERARLEGELEELKESLESCSQDGRPFILGSHDNVFGKADDPAFNEESAVVLDNADCDGAVVALMAEQLAFAYRAEFGIRATVLRFFGAFSADMSPQAPLARWIDAVAEGATLDAVADAPNVCFTSDEDAARAVSAALHCDGADGQIVHVADTRPIPWEDWARSIRRIARPSAEGEPAPWPEGRRSEAGKAQTLMGFACSAERIRVVERYTQRRTKRS